MVKVYVHLAKLKTIDIRYDISVYFNKKMALKRKKIYDKMKMEGVNVLVNSIKVVKF
jgi:hypothetical protein